MKRIDSPALHAIMPKLVCRSMPAGRACLLACRLAASSGQPRRPAPWFPFCLVAGNNLEAGLGALVAKRLLDAQLAAKQRQAERMQQELEVGSSEVGQGPGTCCKQERQGKGSRGRAAGVAQFLVLYSPLCGPSAQCSALISALPLRSLCCHNRIRRPRRRAVRRRRPAAPTRRKQRARARRQRLQPSPPASLPWHMLAPPPTQRRRQQRQGQ